jgi:hypothetical protein
VIRYLVESVVNVTGLQHSRQEEFEKTAIFRDPRLTTLEEKKLVQICCDVAGLWHCKIAEFGKAAIIRIPQMKTLEKTHKLLQSVVNVAGL